MVRGMQAAVGMQVSCIEWVIARFEGVGSSAAAAACCQQCDMLLVLFLIPCMSTHLQLRRQRKLQSGIQAVHARVLHKKRESGFKPFHSTGAGLSARPSQGGRGGTPPELFLLCTVAVQSSQPTWNSLVPPQVRKKTGKRGCFRLSSAAQSGSNVLKMTLRPAPSSSTTCSRWEAQAHRLRAPRNVSGPSAQQPMAHRHRSHAPCNGSGASALSLHHDWMQLSQPVHPGLAFSTASTKWLRLHHTARIAATSMVVGYLSCGREGAGAKQAG